MPNEKVLREKQEIVDELAERLTTSAGGVFIDYKGVNVAQDNELRSELRKNGVQYAVIKNTLANLAFDRVGFGEIAYILSGTTSLATAEDDPIVPIRIISEYSKKFGDIFNIKAGFMEGKVMDLSQVAEIAELPSKDALYSRVLGTMLAPITSLAIVLGQILEQKNTAAEVSD